MMRRCQWVTCGSVAALSLLWQLLGDPWRVLLFLIGGVASAVVGAVSYIALRLHFSPKFSSSAPLPKTLLKFQESLARELARREHRRAEEDRPAAPRITRNIDRALNEIVEIVSGDYVLYWFDHLMDSTVDSRTIFKRDCWVTIDSLSERLSKVDMVKLLAVDVVKVVSDHFERIRLANELQLQTSTPKYPVSPHLLSSEREVEYLGKLAEALVILLCPPDYGDCLPVRHLLREVLARHVFLPAVELVTSPFYINSKILSYIKSLKEIERKGTGRAESAFVYADSFEDFLRLIDNANDASELKQIRYNIALEIVQATTLDNLREAKSSYDGDKNEQEEKEVERHRRSSPGVSVKHYIKQLLHAKTLCDRRLTELGCLESGGSSNSPEGSSGSHVSFKVVMNSAFTRKFFSRHLEENGRQDLLGFWSSVQELRTASRTEWHQLATEIYYGYINKSWSESMQQLDRTVLRRIEAFLIGDSSDPEVFFQLQKRAEESLREDFFPSFLVSDHCRTMIKEAEANEISIAEENDSPDIDIVTKDDDAPKESLGESPGRFAPGHSGWAKTHLEQISEKLQNKIQAMMALKSSLKPDSRILQMLQQEVDTLEIEKKAVSEHIERTESWADNLGQWQCHVQSVEPHEGEGNQSSGLQATLAVFVPQDQKESPASQALSSSKTSWTCVRKIPEFHSLHRELTPFVGWVKSLELPSQFKSLLFRNPSSKATLEKSRQLLQKFMDQVLEDEQLNRSEILYSFLSPSPKYLKTLHPHETPAKTATSKAFAPFSNFFRGGSSNNSGEAAGPGSESGISPAIHSSGPSSSMFGVIHHREDQQGGGGSGSQDEEDRFWFDEFDRVDSAAAAASGRDTSAESIYALVGEVFDLRGVFKWMRKSLMTFVQITYGSSINRQIRDSVAWLTSEQMILRYLNSFKKVIWVNNSSVPQSHPPAAGMKVSGTSSSQQQSAILANETKEALLENIPEVLVNLVGQQGAVNGTVKIFETLQNATLNKQLLYDVLEMCVYEIFPELGQTG